MFVIMLFIYTGFSQDNLYCQLRTLRFGNYEIISTLDLLMKPVLPLFLVYFGYASGNHHTTVDIDVINFSS